VHSVASEYLEAIYTLHAEGDDAFAVTLAELFAVSRANASATVGRLGRDGLVETRGRQILLTEAGTARAEAAILRHRLTECFLMEVLGMDWEVVHEQARSFERGITAFLEERIDHYSGMPRTCPHGNPIPRPDLNAATYLRDRGAARLGAFPAGAPATILAISELVEGRADALCFCAAQGLRPGAHIDRVEQEGGGTAVVMEGRRVIVEAVLANHIWAVPSDERGVDER
jgi:DtxR family Mn-dependent transcriptional regulator